MKVKLSIVLALLLLFAIALNAQSTSSSVIQLRKDIANTKVSLKAKEAPISTILGDLMTMADVVLYNQISAGKKQPNVTIEIEDMPFLEALNRIVKSVGLTYRIVEEHRIYIGDEEDVWTTAEG